MIIGYNEEGPSITSPMAGDLKIMSAIVVTQTVKLRSITARFYLANAVNAQWRGFLYADNTQFYPTNLMAQTNTGTVNWLGSRWHTLDFTSQPILQPGTYWIGGHWPNNNNQSIWVTTPLPAGAPANHLFFFNNDNFADGTSSPVGDWTGLNANNFRLNVFITVEDPKTSGMIALF